MPQCETPAFSHQATGGSRTQKRLVHWWLSSIQAPTPVDPPTAELHAVPRAKAPPTPVLPGGTVGQKAWAPIPQSGSRSFLMGHSVTGPQGAWFGPRSLVTGNAMWPWLGFAGCSPLAGRPRRWGIVAVGPSGRWWTGWGPPPSLWGGHSISSPLACTPGSATVLLWLLALGGRCLYKLNSVLAVHVPASAKSWPEAGSDKM